ncbi:MAG: sensor histidine kinase [Acidobacteria bacterium]|nr:sensor histidine kinase [Acidobacteriota bacterium]
MRLSEFLVTDREQILTAWVAFARSGLSAADGSCPPTKGMDVAALRDHASEMLDAIAADLKTPQSKVEQADKSEGKSDAEPQSGVPDTAAQSHGAARADSGFSVEQMVAEYRALRASVIRLWVDSAGELALEDLEDLIRFNEAIDQSLAESTSRFMQDLDYSKEIFLGMLGHDLRNPLGAIIGSAHVMANSQELPERLLKNASLVLKSGQRMNALVGDLLDFTRSRLGGGIPIVRADVDLAGVCRHTVEEVAALHPQRVLNFEATGPLQGQWDQARVSQALSNVIGNAVEHGSDTAPINVMMRGDADHVEIAVQNWGPVIPSNQLDKVFAPMHRVDADKPGAPSSNLGLGLYISDRIVASHGGTIGVESSDEKGTTFTIRLPKRTLTMTTDDLVESKVKATDRMDRESVT